MVVVAMLNGVFLRKIPWVSPWYIGGSGLALIGSALMRTFIQLASANNWPIAENLLLCSNR